MSQTHYKPHEQNERYLYQLFRLITTARRMKISRVVRALQDLIDRVGMRYGRAN